MAMVIGEDQMQPLKQCGGLHCSLGLAEHVTMRRRRGRRRRRMRRMMRKRNEKDSNDEDHEEESDEEDEEEEKIRTRMKRKTVTK